MNTNRLLMIMSCVVLLAVSSTPATAKTSAHCYHGARSTVTPGGKSLGRVRVLYRRTIIRAKRQIVEQLAIYQDPQNPDVSGSILKLSGNRYSFVNPIAKLKGNGTLLGKRWKWSQWTSEATVNKRLTRTLAAKIVGKTLTMNVTISLRKKAIGRRIFRLKRVSYRLCDAQFGQLQHGK